MRKKKKSGKKEKEIPSKSHAINSIGRYFHCEKDWSKYDQGFIEGKIIGGGGGGGGYLPGVINTPSLGRLPSIVSSVVRFKATKRVVELGVGAHVLSGMHTPTTVATQKLHEVGSQLEGGRQTPQDVYLAASRTKRGHISVFTLVNSLAFDARTRESTSRSPPYREDKI